MTRSGVLRYFLFFYLLVLSACSRQPSEIRLSDLETACDHVEAIDGIVDEMIVNKGEQPMKELSEEEIEVLRSLKKKMRLVERAAKKKYIDEELEECPGFDGLKEKVERLASKGDIFKFGFK